MFIVRFNEALWLDIMKEAESIYGGKDIKRPTRITEGAKGLKVALDIFLESHVTLVREVPSVTTCSLEHTEQDTLSPYYFPDV